MGFTCTMAFSAILSRFAPLLETPWMSKGQLRLAAYFPILIWFYLLQSRLKFLKHSAVHRMWQCSGNWPLQLQLTGSGGADQTRHFEYPAQFLSQKRGRHCQFPWALAQVLLVALSTLGLCILQLCIRKTFLLDAYRFPLTGTISWHCALTKNMIDW